MGQAEVPYLWRAMHHARQLPALMALSVLLLLPCAPRACASDMHDVMYSTWGSEKVQEWAANILPDGPSLSAFAAQTIDGPALVRLSSEDLKGFGIKSIGHRKKLLTALAKLQRDSLLEETESAESCDSDSCLGKAEQTIVSDKVAEPVKDTRDLVPDMVPDVFEELANQEPEATAPVAGLTHHKSVSENISLDEFADAAFPLDDNSNYNSLAIQAAQRDQDEVKANKLFARASFMESNRNDVWSNLGLSHQNTANIFLQQGNKKGARKRALRHLQEAINALDMAIALGDGSQRPRRNHVLGILQREFPSKCPVSGDSPDACDVYDRQVKALQLVEDGDSEAAVLSLCKLASAIEIHVSEKEKKRGTLLAQTVFRAKAVFTVCGVVAFPDLMPPRLIDQVHKAQQDVFSDFESQIPHDKPAYSTEAPFEDPKFGAAEHSPDRFELKFPQRAPFTDRPFSANRFLLSLVKSALGSARIELDTFSSVTARPGAPDQHWHSDVGHLWKNSKNYLSIPAQGLIVIVPLMNLTKKTGTTEFMLGSHKEENPGRRLDNSDFVVPLYRFYGKAGSFLYFDPRVMHRGLANKSKRKRPITYMGYVHEWYYDTVNFKIKHTASFDNYKTLAEKKLFSRIDHNAYVLQLEKLVQEAGHDLDALQSVYDYKQVNLVL